MSASTTSKGNTFRDKIRDLLLAAGYDAKTEQLLGGKVVDVVAHKKIRFRVERLGIEAKHYERPLPIGDVLTFSNEYQPLLRNGLLDQAILVSTHGITPHGHSHILTVRSEGIEHYDWPSFQREVFGADDYLRALIQEYERDELESYFIPPRTVEGDDLETLVRDWIADSTAPPLVIFGHYGTGKSTFARTLAKRLASESLHDHTVRVPILVPLGGFVDDQSLDGLFGALLASRYNVEGYHYKLFQELNRLGRFVIIYDGLDEMKHGMTFASFSRTYDHLLELHTEAAKIIVLGRPNVFANDTEFRAVIKGRVITPHGNEIPSPNRPECRDIELAGFNDAEATAFVTRYFSYIVPRRHISQEEHTKNLNIILSGEYRALIRRPVHAQMLCQIAARPGAELEDVDEFRLYDRFIHLLLDREVSKDGRYSGFNATHRRSFNGAVAWWLLTKGASTTSVHDVPSSICHGAVQGVSHDFDEDALRRELVKGCLTEKSSGTVYFGHRSIQEFLAAEYLFETAYLTKIDKVADIVREVGMFSTAEVRSFLKEFFDRSPRANQIAEDVISGIQSYRGTSPLDYLESFIYPYRKVGDKFVSVRSLVVFLRLRQPILRLVGSATWATATIFVRLYNRPRDSTGTMVGSGRDGKHTIHGGTRIARNRGCVLSRQGREHGGSCRKSPQDQQAVSRLERGCEVIRHDIGVCRREAGGEHRGCKTTTVCVLLRSVCNGQGSTLTPRIWTNHPGCVAATKARRGSVAPAVSTV